MGHFNSFFWVISQESFRKLEFWERLCIHLIFIFLNNLRPISYNVPVVYDVLVARISKRKGNPSLHTFAFAGQPKCGAVSRGNAYDLGERNPSRPQGRRSVYKPVM